MERKSCGVKLLSRQHSAPSSESDKIANEAVSDKSMYTLRKDSKVIKLFACSTQLSMNFTMLINAKMPKIVDILTFISMIKIASESFKVRKVFIFSILIFMSS